MISNSLKRLWNEYNDFFENELHLDHWDQGQRMEALFDSLKKWKYKIIQKKNKHIGFVMWGVRYRYTKSSLIIKLLYMRRILTLNTDIKEQ